MAQILKLFHLLDQHRVTQVQIGSRGIEAGLDFKWPSLLELGEQFFLGQDLSTPLDYVELCVNVCHDSRQRLMMKSQPSHFPRFTIRRIDVHDRSLEHDIPLRNFAFPRYLADKAVDT